MVYYIWSWKYVLKQLAALFKFMNIYIFMVCLNTHTDTKDLDKPHTESLGSVEAFSR